MARVLSDWVAVAGPKLRQRDVKKARRDAKVAHAAEAVAAKAAEESAREAAERKAAKRNQARARARRQAKVRAEVDKVRAAHAAAEWAAVEPGGVACTRACRVLRTWHERATSVS